MLRRSLTRTHKASFTRISRYGTFYTAIIHHYTSLTDLAQPDNILIDGDRVLLADWGFAHEWTFGRPSTVFCGTRGYWAPEIAANQPFTGPEVDCWSLGVTLYALACSRLPFNPHSPRLNEEIQAGSYIMPSYLSPELASLIAGLLCPDPRARFTIGGTPANQQRDSIPPNRENPPVRTHLLFLASGARSFAFTSNPRPIDVLSHPFCTPRRPRAKVTEDACTPPPRPSPLSPQKSFPRPAVVTRQIQIRDQEPALNLSLPSSVDSSAPLGDALGAELRRSTPPLPSESACSSANSPHSARSECDLAEETPPPPSLPDAAASDAAPAPATAKDRREGHSLVGDKRACADHQSTSQRGNGATLMRRATRVVFAPVRLCVALLVSIKT